ncbi:MDR family MFS transporter [Bosea sp. 117]|uniref:MDR family MFS transporter n=1 Tax=Bosea sp. 117 TaxID=1125973 RepID=UPI000494CBC5|nr:MDR family MFS transporter [Bosea sp. 117]
MDTRTPGSDAHAPEKLSPADIRAVLTGVMLAMFLGALDQTIVSTALPTIGVAFGDVENLPWIVTAYLLTATAATPLVGKLADIHGPRPVLRVGIALFLVGSVMCALAPSMLWLIIGRAVQGAGGGGLISLAQTIIGLMVAPRERGRYQAYFAAVFMTSSISGPVLGGFFAEHLHWSLIFWINLPIGLVAAFASDRALRRLPPHEHPHRLDFIGALLMCAATTALLLALSWGGTQYAWSSPVVLGLLGLSALLWASFAVRIFTAIEPLLPLSVLANPVVAACVVAAAFAMGTMVGLSIEIPLYLEGVQHLSSSQSGVTLIALMAGVVVGASLTGRIMGRVAHYKPIPLVGLSCAIAALAGMAVLSEALATRPAAFAALLAVAGIGLGTALPVTTVAIQNAVPIAQIGTATAVMNFFRSLGSAVLTAAFSAIVLGLIDVGGEVSAQMLIEKGMADQLAAAFHWVFAASAVSLGVSLLAIVLMEERPLRTTVHTTSAVE